MINLRQIEAFKSVMIEKTATRAAQVLHISQPAVSRLLNDLEYYVGFDLFVRSKGKLEPTPEAHALFEEVERSFVGLERIIGAARDIREFRTGRLFICAMPALSLSLLPQVVHNFSRKHPDISISFQAHSSQRVMEWIATQQCDVGFIGLNITDSGVKRVRLAEGALKVVMPADHPLGHHRHLSPLDLRDQPMVSLGQQLDVRPQVEQAFSQAGVRLNTRIETQLSSVACEMVLAGAGLSLVDPITAHAYSHRGLAVRDFTPAIRFPWTALLPAFRPTSRLAKDFIEETRQVLRRTLFPGKRADSA